MLALAASALVINPPIAYAQEPANVRMHANGRVDVFLGSGAHGQGLETTTAQLVAENLGVDYADVTVRLSNGLTALQQ